MFFMKEYQPNSNDLIYINNNISLCIYRFIHTYDTALDKIALFLSTVQSPHVIFFKFFSALSTHHACFFHTCTFVTFFRLAKLIIF
jgi:hypothetical protein